MVTAVHNETVKLFPHMQLNPEHLVNIPNFPHTPCNWPVVQQRWRDSAILASQAAMAWTAIDHHTTSPQRSQTTGPNIFSGTPRLNQRKAWNNPVRINCVQEIPSHFWDTSGDDGTHCLIGTKYREISRSETKPDRCRAIWNVHTILMYRTLSDFDCSKNSL
jgi:hypothetical protein